MRQGSARSLDLRCGKLTTQTATAFRTACNSARTAWVRQTRGLPSLRLRAGMLRRRVHKGRHPQWRHRISRDQLQPASQDYYSQFAYTDKLGCEFATSCGGGVSSFCSKL